MKNLCKKLFSVALLLCFTLAMIGCTKAKFTVKYFNVVDGQATQIGTETVKEGKTIVGEVDGYVLFGDLFTNVELTEKFDGNVVADTDLYGVFEQNKNEYTYNSTFSLSPSTFNPLQYKSSNDSVPLDYTTTGFYGFSYNADQTGFELTPSMAAEDPIDVTNEYNKDDKWGLKDQTSGFAFRIKLNPDACWDDGTKITADDYIYTMQELLDPKMANYRASNYYAGSTVIYGAKDYFYSGQTGIGEAEMTYKEFSESIYDKLIFTWEDNAKSKFVKWLVDNYGSYLGTPSYPDKVTLLGALGLKFTFTDADVAALSGKKYSEIVANPAEKAIVDELIAAWCTEPNEELNFFEAEYSYPEYSWDNVGLKKIDDYTLDIIYTGELAGFYIKYSIGLPLVNKTLWEKCKKVDDNGVVSSSYGTSVETYIGYGPYKLTKYIVDQIMVFEKNENWFGYTEKYADEYGKFIAEFDGKEHQQFETTKVVLNYVPEISTREQMFLSGQTDVLGLNKEYYDKYKSSVRLYNATGASTYSGIILSDYETLVEREAVDNGVEYSPTYDGSVQKYNKTILSIKEFRQALCYAIDRKTLCANLYPGGSPATSLFSDLILADPENGVALNKFDATKKVICEFWGVEWGEGKEFETLDEAYNAITGYDLAQAKELVEVAYKKAIEQKLMGEKTIVRIDYCGSTDTETEKLWYQTFLSCFTALFEGTSLEGRFIYNYNTNLGSDFGAAIQNGLADTAWGFGWSGGELDPYSLFEVYVDAAAGKDEPYQYDKWINRNTEAYNITLKLDVDGKGEKEYTYTAYEWFLILNGDTSAPDNLNWKYLKVKDEIRAQVLAECQKAVLLDYTQIPMFNQGSVQLLTYKCNYGKETYMFGMGFGGIRYMTYNFTDTEWKAYLNENNGVIKY